MAEKFGFSCWQVMGMGVINIDNSGGIGRLLDGCDQPLPPFDDDSTPTVDLVNYILDHIQLGKVVRDDAARICREHNVEPFEVFLDRLVKAWFERKGV